MDELIKRLRRGCNCGRCRLDACCCAEMENAADALTTLREENARLREAMAVAVEKFADCGPGQWWFVHHPDGFLIECALENRARQIAEEINAGRSVLTGGKDD